jgi:hypothetical protein
VPQPTSVIESSKHHIVIPTRQLVYKVEKGTITVLLNENLAEINSDAGHHFIHSLDRNRCQLYRDWTLQCSARRSGHGLYTYNTIKVMIAFKKVGKALSNRAISADVF